MPAGLMKRGFTAQSSHSGIPMREGKHGGGMFRWCVREVFEFVKDPSDAVAFPVVFEAVGILDLAGGARRDMATLPMILETLADGIGAVALFHGGGVGVDLPAGLIDHGSVISTIRPIALTQDDAGDRVFAQGGQVDLRGQSTPRRSQSPIWTVFIGCSGRRLMGSDQGAVNEQCGDRAQFATGNAPHAVRQARSQSGLTLFAVCGGISKGGRVPAED